MTTETNLNTQPQPSSAPTQGDIVIITESAFQYAHSLYCVATEGSIASVLSFAEYCELYNRRIGTGFGCLSPDALSTELLAGRQYPFRIEYVAPELDGNDYSVNCEKLDLVVLDSRFFRIISGRYVRLSDDDLMLLGKVVDDQKRTIAHLLAAKGFHFTDDQLNKLGNPADTQGTTVAQVMATIGDGIRTR